MSLVGVLHKKSGKSIIETVHLTRLCNVGHWMEWHCWYNLHPLSQYKYGGSISPIFPFGSFRWRWHLTETANDESIILLSVKFLVVFIEPSGAKFELFHHHPRNLIPSELFSFVLTQWLLHGWSKFWRSQLVIVSVWYLQIFPVE